MLCGYTSLSDIIDPKFVKGLKYRFERTHLEGSYEDIYDGDIYIRHASFLTHKFNLSFSLNFDGAPKFKSSGVQLWPIQLIINELPPFMRLIITQIWLWLLVALFIIVKVL